MSRIFYTGKFSIARRLVQISLLMLFVGANYWGWIFLQGNYSSALVVESFYLTDPYAVLQTLFAGFLVATDALVGALIIFGIYALIFGRAFCSWVCPVNIIADLSNSIHRKLRLKKSFSKISINRNVRYWLMVGFLVISIFVGAAAFEFISPVSMLHRGIIFGMGASWLVVLFLIFMDVFIKPYTWCGHLCPLGAFYSLISKYRVLKVKHYLDKCTNCNDCFEVCPEKQVLDIVGVKDGFIIPGECTLCGKCVDVCDDQALKFSVTMLKEKSGGN